MVTSRHQSDLFASRPLPAAQVPLAERVRPRQLAEIVGQPHLLGPDGALTRLVAAHRPISLILGGPPGSGKTTLAHLMAKAWGLRLTPLSATETGVAHIRAIASEAQQAAGYGTGRIGVFIDEIHRFTRAQQDALLPHVEAGRFILIGATTENPSYVINRALASRCRLFSLVPLQDVQVAGLLRAALKDTERGLASLGVDAPAEALAQIVGKAQGDVRTALGALELAALLAQQAGRTQLADQDVQSAVASMSLAHDRADSSHYDLLSAFIKSMRRSATEDAVYYLARLIEGGEPASVVLRRLLIFAAEDIGPAEPMALVTVNAVAAAFDRVGLPEGKLLLSHAVQALSTAPKSRSNELAYARAAARVQAEGAVPVPKSLRNKTVSGRH